MTYSRGVIISLFIHMLFGASNIYQQPGLNVLQEFILPFANQSYFDHYGVALTSKGYTWLWSTLQSAQMAGALCSTLVLPPLMDIFGRRNTVMIISNGILLAGLACQMLAKPTNSFEIFGCGQFLGGLAYGSFRVLYQFFAERRATVLFSLAHVLWMNLGVALAFPMFFGTNEMWPWFYFISLFPCLLYFFSAYLVPESPKFLYLQKHARRKAEDSIRYYHGNSANIEILQSYEREVVDENDRNNRISYQSLLTNPFYRQALIICLFANIGVNVQCNHAITQYSNGLMLQLGLNAKESLSVILISTFALGAMSLWMAIYGINRFGRVTILVGSSLLFAAAACVLGSQFALKDANLFSHKTSILLVAVWSLMLLSGAGFHSDGIAHLLIGELSPNVAAAKTVQVCSFLGQGTGLLVLLILPPLLEDFGSIVFFGSAVISLLCAFLFSFTVPETKGKSVGDMIRRNTEETPLLE